MCYIVLTYKNVRNQKEMLAGTKAKHFFFCYDTYSLSGKNFLYDRNIKGRLLRCLKQSFVIPLSGKIERKEDDYGFFRSKKCKESIYNKIWH